LHCRPPIPRRSSVSYAPRTRFPGVPPDPAETEKVSPRTYRGRGPSMERFPLVDQSLLDILVCPDTKQPVERAADDVLAQLNAAIREGSVTNRGGQAVVEPLEEGLVRSDGKVLYPVRDDIPIMLIDESIQLSR